jgi:hypothetical protein
MSEPFFLWMVYDHPKDCPEHFVARRFVIAPGRAEATGDIRIGVTLDELHAALPEGLQRVGPTPNDPGVVLEVWL